MKSTEEILAIAREMETLAQGLERRGFVHEAASAAIVREALLWAIGEGGDHFGELVRTLVLEES